MIDIQRADPRHPDILSLLEQSQRLMNSLYSEEACHMLSVEDLCSEDVLFYGASLDDTYIGCVGLVLKETYGEIKSMFVDPSHRGLGLAKMLMATLEGVAREHQLKSIKLETGELLKEAVALYRRHGFTSCDPFGDYADHPDSLFMTKNLDSPIGP